RSNFTLIAALLPLIPPPPHSTLFPYATLFRSHQALGRLRDVALRDRSLPLRHRDLGEIRREILHRQRLEALDVLDRRLADHEGEDRKSTRLNSSHLGISYAVFCLKKKKISITS